MNSKIFYDNLIYQENLSATKTDGMQIYTAVNGAKSIALYSSYNGPQKGFFYGLSQKQFDWLYIDESRFVYILAGSRIIKIPAKDFLESINKKNPNKKMCRKFNIIYKGDKLVFMHDKVELNQYFLEFDLLDDDDKTVQNEIDLIDENEALKYFDGELEKLKIAIQNQQRTLVRNPIYSKKAKINSGYKCELDDIHETFISKASGKPYIEGHHIIPCTLVNSEYYMSKYGRNIDCVSNIISLCPNCHRKIHLSSNDSIKQMLKLIYDKRKNTLASAGILISLEELLRLYGLNLS